MFIIIFNIFYIKDNNMIKIKTINLFIVSTRTMSDLIRLNRVQSVESTINYIKSNGHVW